MGSHHVAWWCEWNKWAISGTLNTFAFANVRWKHVPNMRGTQLWSRRFLLVYRKKMSEVLFETPLNCSWAPRQYRKCNRWNVVMLIDLIHGLNGRPWIKPISVVSLSISITILQIIAAGILDQNICQSLKDKEVKTWKTKCIVLLSPTWVRGKGQNHTCVIRYHII